MIAGDKEGRDTPKSDRGREEDEKMFGPMGREGKIGCGKKNRLGKKLVGGVGGDDGGEMEGETWLGGSAWDSVCDWVWGESAWDSFPSRRGAWVW